MRERRRALGDKRLNNDANPQVSEEALEAYEEAKRKVAEIAQEKTKREALKRKSAEEGRQAKKAKQNKNPKKD